MATESELFYSSAPDSKFHWHTPEIHKRSFGYAVLDEATIDSLRKYAPFIEIGAGAGYWSYCLCRAGVDSIPTDLYLQSDPMSSFPDTAPWIPIKKMDAKKAAKKYPDRTLLTVWPSFQLAWPYQAVKAYRGNTIVYVGDRDRTGDERFHALLCDSKKWKLVEEISIPHFFYVHDRVYVYRRVRKWCWWSG